MAARRLPVIQEPSGEDAEAAARPAWHWVLIGSGLLVTIWTPSVVVALAVARKISVAETARATLAAVLVAASLALASAAAGYLVGRFGRRARGRHAAGSGALAALEIWLIALFGGALTSPLLGLSVLLSVTILTAGFSALGSFFGRRAALRPAPAREP